MDHTPVTIDRVIEALDCEVIWGGDRLKELRLTACFAADLMSEVLAFSEPEALLITGLTNVQAVHTADVAEMRAILFVNGKRPGEQVLDLARERGIPLLTTKHTMFEACGILHRNGMKGTGRG